MDKRSVVLPRQLSHVSTDEDVDVNHPDLRLTPRYTPVPRTKSLADILKNPNRLSELM